MAKKTKITPELIELARQNVKLGFSYAALAASLNISEDTLYSWFRRARESGEQPYTSFYAAVREGEAELLTECLESVKASMKHDVKAAFFMLEKRFSSDYGKSSQLNINAETRNQNLNLNVNTTMTADELNAIRMKILEKLSRPARPPELKEG